MSLSKDRQTARAVVRIGNSFRARARVDVSPAGLLAITALVSGILLSTGALVGIALREKERVRRLSDRIHP